MKTTAATLIVLALIATQALAQDLSGRWRMNTTGIGQTVWTLTPTGGNAYTAQEYGMGNARGTGYQNGNRLTIYWATPNGSHRGTLEYAINSGNTFGSGRQVFQQPSYLGSKSSTFTRLSTSRPPQPSPRPAPSLQSFSSKYLRVYNNTSRTLKVHIQWRSNRSGSWRWYPDSNRDLSLVYRVPAGSNGVIKDTSGRPIIANRIRIWAVDDAGNVTDEHRHRSCWLVPTNPDGRRRYRARDRSTHGYVFR